LTSLKEHAEGLWGDQKDVLEHASQVVREASRQAANYAREEVSPRVRDTLDHNVRPAVATGVASARSVASSARDKLADEVLPAVTSALGSALAVIEVAKDERVREALKTISAASDTVSKRVNSASDTVSKRVSAAGDTVSKRVTDASAKATKAGAKFARVAKVAPKKSAGPGRYILIGVILVALAGIAYAAWQTLRADDDLWIDEDETATDEAV
jgi:vacuolar-type H+-ATPase subunit H